MIFNSIIGMMASKGSYPLDNSLELIENGTFAPATTATGVPSAFQSMDKGWRVCFGMETFWGNVWGATGTPPAPSFVNIPNVDIDTWVSQAVYSGAKYSIITAVTEFGYQLWPSGVTYADARIGSSNHLSPAYPDYTIRNYGDNNILDKFINKHKAAGIAPGVYYNLAVNWNLAGSTNIITTVWDSSDNRRAEWILFCCLQLQELVAMGFEYIWLDSFAFLTVAEYQKIYNAVKSIDPNCFVIINCVGNTTFAQYPHDAESHEGFVVEDGSTAYRTTARTYGGTTYYIPQELVISPYARTSPQKWYNYDNATGRAFPYNPALLSQATLQGIYAGGRAYNCPFLMAVTPGTNGVIPSAEVELFKNLTL